MYGHIITRVLGPSLQGQLVVLSSGNILTCSYPACHILSHSCMVASSNITQYVEFIDWQWWPTLLYCRALKYLKQPQTHCLTCNKGQFNISHVFFAYLKSRRTLRYVQCPSHRAPSHKYRKFLHWNNYNKYVGCSIALLANNKVDVRGSTE